jgi:hypothetical protein
MGEDRKMYKVLVGNSEGKRPFGRPRHRWDQNGCWEDWLVGGGGLEWISWLRIEAGGELF